MTDSPVPVEGTHRIMPADIDLGGWAPLLSTFGYGEVEWVAAEYIKKCQKAGQWLALTEAEYLEVGWRLLDNYHWMDDEEDQRFKPNPYSASQFHLVDRGFILLGPDGKYRVTEKFIKQCHDQHPVKK